MAITMGQPGGWRQVPQKSLLAVPNGRAVMVKHFSAFPTYDSNGSSFGGARCEPCQRFWPLVCSPPPRLRQRIAASSSSPTRPTGTASINASPRAKNAVPQQPFPIAGRGISPKRPRFAGLIRRKSPVRFPGNPPTATIPGVTNTLPLPASASVADPAAARGAGLPPYRRPGNDVTLPREAANGSRAGVELGFPSAKSS